MKVTLREVGDALARADLATLEPGDHTYLIVAERKYVSQDTAYKVMQKLQQLEINVLWLWTDDASALQVLRMDGHKGANDGQENNDPEEAEQE